MCYLVILSESTRLIVDSLLVAAALGATWVAIASYKHTRNAEIAKQCDVIALDLKVEKKADQKDTDERFKVVHKRIDEVKEDHGKILQDIQADIKTILREMPRKTR